MYFAGLHCAFATSAIESERNGGIHQKLAAGIILRQADPLAREPIDLRP
jgi:hypothetical protein